MLKLPSGKSFAQTNALTCVLGRHCGLAPESEDDDAVAQKLVCDAGDLVEEVLANKPAERLNKWLTYVDGCLSPTSGFFLETLSYADFGMYAAISIIDLKQVHGKLPGVIVPKNLRKWHSETMAAIPAVAEMNKTRVPILPKFHI